MILWCITQKLRLPIGPVGFEYFDYQKRVNLELICWLVMQKLWRWVTHQPYINYDARVEGLNMVSN